MPSEDPKPGSPEDWLRYAASDLALAQAETTPAILLESLCFHAQQAAEKALKAVLVARGTSFPLTHNLKTLLDLLPQNVLPPQEVRDAAGLTDYAVMSRYPGDLEAVTEEEHQEAVRMAEAVVRWAQTISRGESG